MTGAPLQALAAPSKGMSLNLLANGLLLEGAETPRNDGVHPFLSLDPKLLTTVELFCGIGGFRVASDRLGLKTVWANDLSELACPVYRDRFGSDVLHQGDINALRDAIPAHDILTAGFPCQPFSAAGKKEGVRDPRGTLFQSIVDVLAEKKPKHFVLENVKRLLSMEQGVHFATVLAALSSLGYFIEWRVLNAKHFGIAQNRERVFVVGTRADGLSAEECSVMSTLRLVSAVDLESTQRGVVQLLERPTKWKALNSFKSKFPKWGVMRDGMFLACDVDVFSAALPGVTLEDVLEPAVSPEYDYTERTLARLHLNESVDRFVQGVEVISNQGGGARMGYTIFGVRGLSPTLTASTSRHYERYHVGKLYRRLTPVEYARLQGFPDDHCASARGYDQYLLYGNAVPPPMAEWVLGRLLNRVELGDDPSALATQRELLDV